MRWTLALLLFTACLEPQQVGEGADCTGENSGACDPSTHQLLQCQNSHFVIYSDCKGPNGCVSDTETVSCDSTRNTAGDICAPESLNKVRCEPDGGTHILRCIDRVLTVIDECAPPTICGFSDGGLTCI